MSFDIALINSEILCLFTLLMENNLFQKWKLLQKFHQKKILILAFEKVGGVFDVCSPFRN
jgi:hypothetical protein